MKLYANPASPFVRKVLVVAHERGLADRIETVTAMVTPVSVSAELAAANPLAKIPTLVLDDGTALFDSRVIAEYLDTLAGPKLFPESGPARWTALRRQAVADGLLDAAILMRYEAGFRPPERQSQDWIDGQFRKVRGALDALETEAVSFDGAASIGEIAAGCALGYLDFRFPAEDWRATHPVLTKFHAEFAERPSARATRPPA